MSDDASAFEFRPTAASGTGLATSDAGSDPAGTRWLASRVLGEKSAALLRGVPAPWLVSARLDDSTRMVRDYVAWWIRHPEAGGSFDRRTRRLRWLPDRVLVWLLLALAYDGIVYPYGERIEGHVFYQRHGRALHAFSTAVSGGLAHKGGSVVMMLDYLAHAAALGGIEKARVGKGQNNVTRRLLERLAEHEGELGWRVSPDGWVFFSR
jgi:hypothetical protein